MSTALILFGAICGVVIGWYFGRRYEQMQAHLTLSDQWRRVWRSEVER